MRFAAFPVAEVAGMILGHSVHTDRAHFKKGHLISQSDLQILQESGVTKIYAASLEETDVSENDAAGTISAALAGNNVTAETPFTGRANITANVDGVFQLDEALIHNLNKIDEAITIATLRSDGLVKAGQMLTTVKIIPFAVPCEVLQQALSMIDKQPPAVSVSELSLTRADLILTTLPKQAPKLLAKAERVITDRLGDIGVELTSVRHCLHNEKAVAACLSQSDSGTELTLILGASATVDRGDVVPEGISKAGGSISYFGMPVDPGNLLLLANFEGRPVLGLPGCARSPKLNGADWVLQRLIARVPVTPADIQAMGVGGLLKEIPSRPQPRANKTRETSTPRVAAIILAAGQSRRMGDINKLTAKIDGKPMVAHVADAALSSKADEIILVTGHQEDIVLAALAGRPLTHVVNNDYTKGLSSSVRTGIEAASKITPPVDAAIILLGDMPYVDANIINQLISAHSREEDCFICVPTVEGKRGNPVLWDAVFFNDLQNLQGDVGAKHLIVEHADLVYEVPVTNNAPLTDIDTPKMLADQPKS